MTETLIRDDDYRPCPHGDETCPCQDAYGGQWDLCNYEGENPMRCR